MRTMIIVRVPVEAGNAAIRSGEITRLIGAFVEQHKPEAAYFYSDPADGTRTALFVIDMQDPTQIPGIAEPFFIGVNASVRFLPVMTGDELNQGLTKWAASQ